MRDSGQPGRGVRVCQVGACRWVDTGGGRWRRGVSTRAGRPGAAEGRDTGGPVAAGEQEMWWGGPEWFHTAAGPRGVGYTCDCHKDAPAKSDGPQCLVRGDLFLRHIWTTGPNAGVLPVPAGAAKGVGGQRDV